MALEAVVLNILRRSDESFSVEVSFQDSGNEVSRRVIPFRSGERRAAVETEIQHVGNFILSTAFSITEAEALRGLRIPIVVTDPRPPIGG